MIHCQVQSQQQIGNFLVTFLYGFNDEHKREDLWGDLEKLAAGIQEPWIVLGDFNEILFANERVGRKAQSIPSTRLRNCMETCDMMDLKYSRSFFTWNNKQKPEDRVFSKIDRAMINSKWSCALPDSEAVFLPELSFDHNPILVSIYREWNSGKKPFPYYNMWKLAPDFNAKVSQCWQGDIAGTRMFKMVSKLRRLKPLLKLINQEGFSDIQKADTIARNDLIAAQAAMTKNPLSFQLMAAEQEANKRYNEVHKAFSMFMSQKAKLNWASYGDENSAFFHASCVPKVNPVRRVVIPCPTNLPVVPASCVPKPLDLFTTRKSSFAGALLLRKAFLGQVVLLSKAYPGSLVKKGLLPTAYSNRYQ
uniref:Uncharacterized protein n=1 Tax=Cannabis sativa TaxID=3483 RepID=A0A803NI13_CANSA